MVAVSNQTRTNRIVTTSKLGNKTSVLGQGLLIYPNAKTRLSIFSFTEELYCPSKIRKQLESLVTSALQIRSLATKFYKMEGLQLSHLLKLFGISLVYLNIERKVSLTQIDLNFNTADLEIWEKFVK